LRVATLIFLPNTVFITVRLLRFGVKVKRAYRYDTTFTDSAVALHCVKAHRQSQWRSPI